MKILQSIIVSSLLVASTLLAAITGETDVRKIPSYTPTSAVLNKQSQMPVGMVYVADKKYMIPQYAVKFSEILKARIPARYKNHPELVQADIKRVFDFRQKNHVLGVPHSNNGVLYDYYVGISFYQELTGTKQQSKSLTTAHGEMIMIPIGEHTSSISHAISNSQKSKGNEHSCPTQYNSPYDEYNGFRSKDGTYMWVGASGLGDSFHELGHILNIPCSCSPINTKCTASHQEKISGISGVYIERECEFVNTLSMLRATGYNDLGVDMDAGGLSAYRKVVETILNDKDYDVKHGREYGRIRNYVLKVGKEAFLRGAVKYMGAIL